MVEQRERDTQALELARTHVCGECGKPLVTPYDGTGLVARCANKEHKGIVKPGDPVIARLEAMRGTVPDDTVDAELEAYQLYEQKRYATWRKRRDCYRCRVSLLEAHGIER